MAEPSDFAQQIRRSMRLLVTATVVLYVCLIASGGYTYMNAQSNREALCALRGDLERRVETSTQFLVDHPQGVADIPAKVIKDGIVNQRRTIRALSGINC